MSGRMEVFAQAYAWGDRWRHYDGEVSYTIDCESREPVDDVWPDEISLSIDDSPMRAYVPDRVECRNKSRGAAFFCSECGCVLQLEGFYGDPTMTDRFGVAILPDFCPHCGRKVVDE